MPRLKIFLLFILLFSCALLCTIDASRRGDLPEDSCDGDWVTVSHDLPLYHLDESRALMNRSNVEQSVRNFLDSACPGQRSAYSCYFTADSPKALQRAGLLERRDFQLLPNSPCVPYTPAAFLKLMRNRKMLMIGDSISAQIWQSFVCSLYRIDESYFDVEYWIEPDCVDPHKCPARPAPKHGHIVDGYLAMRSTKTQMIFEFRSVHGKLKELSRLVQKNNLNENDIVVINYGIFYNSRSEYEAMLQNLSQSLQLVLGHPSSPFIFFRHSTPQHFDTVDGFDDSSRNRSSYECVNSSSFEKDWRNTLAEDIIRPLTKQYPSRFGMIPISYGLYGQHDAHAGNGDCTHYCSPSGIFRYIHTITYNAIYRTLLVAQSLNSTSSRDSTEIERDEREGHNREDVTWKMHPLLRNGDFVQIENDPKTMYLVDKGKLRPFRSLDFFTSKGYDWSKVRRIPVRVGHKAMKGDIFP